jgi:hypothetical protein
MLKPEMNDDGSLTLELNGETMRLSPTELDQAIQEIAQVRARMPDAVAERQPPVDTVYYNPVYKVRLDKETKACLLSIRHPGLGWLNFELPTQEVLNMRTLWNHVVDRMDLEPPVGLYDGPERRREKPH